MALFLQATILPERKAIYLSIVDAAVQVIIIIDKNICLFFQPACFGAGCYIEMATSYH